MKDILVQNYLQYKINVWLHNYLHFLNTIFFQNQLLKTKHFTICVAQLRKLAHDFDNTNRNFNFDKYHFSRLKVSHWLYILFLINNLVFEILAEQTYVMDDHHRLMCNLMCILNVPCDILK